MKVIDHGHAYALDCGLPIACMVNEVQIRPGEGDKPPRPPTKRA